jgi:hypothetical protein
MSHTRHPEIKFSNPGIYHIQVLGNAREELWDCFEGEIDLVSVEIDEQVTTSLRLNCKQITRYTYKL